MIPLYQDYYKYLLQKIVILLSLHIVYRNSTQIYNHTLD